MCLGIYQNICMAERELLIQDKTFDDVLNHLISCQFRDNELPTKKHSRLCSFGIFAYYH